MPWSIRLLCFWPGLARIWLRGDWFSLGVALGFSVLLNLALIASFVWPSLLGDRFPLLIWPLLAVIWLVSYWISSETLRPLAQTGKWLPAAAETPDDTLFIQAQGEYLKGDWIAAEKFLIEQLRRWPRDVESRLLLGTLYRHTRRWESARQQLSYLQKLDEGTDWSFEIQREQELIEMAEAEMAESDVAVDDPEPQPAAGTEIDELEPAGEHAVQARHLQNKENIDQSGGESRAA